jgi:IS30 family transposase
MGKSYNHISRDERVAIGIMTRDGKNLSEIARALGRDKGTISREIKRNSSPKQSYYTMPWAHQKAERRSWRAHRRLRLKNEQIILYVRSKLKEGWSPEQNPDASSKIVPDFQSAMKQSTSIFTVLVESDVKSLLSV